MGCLLTHKWVLGKPGLRFLHPYRMCERCGTMQRGLRDPLQGDTIWETMRERTYVKSVQIRIVRQPSSRLNEWAHRFRLRRTRRSDRTQSDRHTAPI